MRNENGTRNARFSTAELLSLELGPRNQWYTLNTPSRHTFPQDLVVLWFVISATDGRRVQNGIACYTGLS